MQCDECQEKAVYGLCPEHNDRHEQVNVFFANQLLDLKEQVKILTADLESGFMKGAYARLKELQDKENRLSQIDRSGND